MQFVSYTFKGTAKTVVFNIEHIVKVELDDEGKKAVVYLTTGPEPPVTGADYEDFVKRLRDKGAQIAGQSRYGR